MRNYIEVLRLNHWFKNFVVLVGAVAAVVYSKLSVDLLTFLIQSSVATLLACIISSVNYAINDITDEQGDSQHPTKKNRVMPNKKISKTSLHIVAICLLTTSFLISGFFYGLYEVLSLLSLFVAGLLYNIRPVRLKDVPVLDVIAESVNNPIRILIGWFSVSKYLVLPPISFLLLFWALGGILMAAKRYAELKFFLSYDKMQPHLYRKSFKTYSLKKIFAMVLILLIVTLVLFIHISFSYRKSLLLSLPLIIGYFAWLLMIMKEKNSFFREPEKAFTKKPIFVLLTALILSVIILLTLFFH